MGVTKQEYAKMTQKASPPSPSLVNFPKAFIVGGLICCIGQGLTDFWSKVVGMKLDDARAAASITLILIAAILTSLGWFAPIARHAGAGTIVPITGFANSVVSPAIEFKREGLVIGVCAKMFTIAGPVLVYGITASTVFGLILWIIEKVRGA
ncbi:MAG: stage V sporulation protein AC [Clostridia bacterium]|nr:stage V sporulation protein AC [Clostridia bacterium]